MMRVNLPVPPKARVLLAEDEANLRRTTQDLLEMHGFDVSAVHCGRLAIERFNRERPDLVLADITMPDGDGYEILNHVRRHPSNSEVPVIFLTGKSGLREMRAGLRVGVDDYLTKPFEPEELVRAVKVRVDRRQRQLRRWEQLRKAIGHGLTHELRTPLCGVMGFAAILQEEAAAGVPLPAANVASAAMAQMDSCERLVRVVDALGLWAELAATDRETAGAYAAARTAQWERAAGENVRAMAKKGGREEDLAVCLDPATLALPEAHLQLLIQQVCEHALRHSVRGNLVRVIGVRSEERYRLDVRGEGWRLRRSGTLEGAGGGKDEGGPEASDLGIGLAIVQQVADLAGAELRLTPGQHGAEVSVIFPLPVELPGRESTRVPSGAS